LAGTGYGKLRIPELYYQLLPKRKKGVVLVINPLDTLGDNQVREKEGMFSAINLTKLTFNLQVACKIQQGAYNFVYLSPEIFMRNKLWDQIYFSLEFKERLSLVVVDKAHMIYIWGLVDRSHGRSCSITMIVRHEDSGLFFPSCGKIGLHLQFRNNSPLLLLSATCRPAAIEGIMRCLKLNNQTLDIYQGELTRPEIRIIRITMSNSLASNLDLLNVFATKDEIVDCNIIPTLIYSGRWGRTYTVLEVLDLACGTRGSCNNP
jgi:superfamily II DNA helicase RecQ